MHQLHTPTHQQQLEDQSSPTHHHISKYFHDADHRAKDTVDLALQSTCQLVLLLAAIIFAIEHFVIETYPINYTVAQPDLSIKIQWTRHILLEIHALLHSSSGGHAFFLQHPQKFQPTPLLFPVKTNLSNCCRVAHIQVIMQNLYQKVLGQTQAT